MRVMLRPLSTPMAGTDDFESLNGDDGAADGAWTARIIAAAFFFVGAPKDASAETLSFGCSIGGQELSAPLEIDLGNRTINTGKAVLSAELNAETASWREGGVLRSLFAAYLLTTEIAEADDTATTFLRAT